MILEKVKTNVVLIFFQYATLLFQKNGPLFGSFLEHHPRVIKENYVLHEPEHPAVNLIWWWWECEKIVKQFILNKSSFLLIFFNFLFFVARSFSTSKNSHFYFDLLYSYWRCDYHRCWKKPKGLSVNVPFLNALLQQ